MHLYLVPATSARLGLPMIPSSVSLFKSYDSETSEQLSALLHKLPQLEAPFRFFKYAYHAYDSWLNAISDILAVESPAMELFDRAEWALSGYLFASKAAIDHLRSHYRSSGLGYGAIDTRVKECKRQSIALRFGEALRHYVTHTASPISTRHLDYTLTGRQLGIVFLKSDAEKDAKKSDGKGWKDVLQYLPEKINIPESLKEHYLRTMNSVGAHFFSKDVLPSYENFRKLLCSPKDRDTSNSVMFLTEHLVADKPALVPETLDWLLTVRRF
jgi:hypothetical protein